MIRPSISVILSTFNPRRDLFDRVVDAVARQTAPHDKFELIVVDNNSAPPLSSEDIERRFANRFALVREPRQGLVHARAAGIAASAADLFCFVDDDNILEEDYLETALRIAADEPDLGVFGGRAIAAPEKPIGPGLAAFLPYFGVNDQGDRALTGAGDRLGPWTPIGAGLCARRVVAEAFGAFAERSQDALGRTGRSLMSGEDTLFSLFAHQAGLKAGYRPALSLQHVMTADRLTMAYLARLMEGHGRSRVILAGMMDVGDETDPAATSFSDIALNAARRLKGHGFLRAYGMYFWDRGRRRQKEATRSD